MVPVQFGLALSRYGREAVPVFGLDGRTGKFRYLPDIQYAKRKGTVPTPVPVRVPEVGSNGSGSSFGAWRNDSDVLHAVTLLRLQGSQARVAMGCVDASLCMVDCSCATTNLRDCSIAKRSSLKRLHLFDGAKLCRCVCL